MCDTPSLGCVETGRFPFEAMPPPASEGSHDAERTLSVVVAEQAAEDVGEAMAHGAASRLGAGGAFANAGAAAGGAVWAFHLYEMAHDVIEAPSEGRARGILEAAFAVGPGQDIDSVVRRQSRAAGVGAVLSGASDAELDRLAARYPGSSFREGVRSARELGAEHPAELEEARRSYGRVRDDFQEGAAAALVGWRPTSGRSEVFDRGQQVAARRLTDPSDARAQADRSAARRDHAEGFEAKLGGRVDQARLRRDAAYRLGVRRASDALRAGDADATARERAQVRLSCGIDEGRRAAALAG